MAFMISVFALVIGAFPRQMPKSAESENNPDVTTSTVTASSRSTLDMGEDPLSTGDHQIAGNHKAISSFQISEKSLPIICLRTYNMHQNSKLR